jgi:hypothetical protein
MRHFIDTFQLLQMHEPYTFGISEIEAKTRFGNSFVLVKNCRHLIMFEKKIHQLNQNLFMMVRHYCYIIYIYIYNFLKHMVWDPPQI